MNPNYNLSEHKYSSARIQEMKQVLKHKIKRDLNQYYSLGDNKLISNQDEIKQTVLQLLTLKYNNVIENKKLV